jgi:signal transduction histidine kinase
MTDESDITAPPPPASASPRAAAGTGEAAMLVAPVTGQILSVDADLRSRLGLAGSTALPQSIDAAMPALSDLRRRLAGSANDPPTPAYMRLVFWIAGAATLIDARMEILGPDEVRLVCKPEAVPTDAHRPPAVGDTRRAADPQSEASPQGEGLYDAKALADIAARLRVGMMRRHTSDDRTSAPVRGSGPGMDSGRFEADHKDPTTAATDTSSRELAVALARLGHELRTPLSSIAAMAEIIRDARFGPDAQDRYREYAGHIHDSARHALSLVGAMLDPETAVERHEPPPTFVEINVDELLKACLDTIAPLAERAGLRVDLASAGRLPHLVADARALRQILLNLLTNALKFTPRGGVITVSTEHRDDGPLQIAVADTGIGMSTAELAHVARMMTADTVDAGGARASGGRGLGLPMVRRLAAQSGGQVAIDSVLGRGTTVSLAFDKSRLVPV